MDPMLDAFEASVRNVTLSSPELTLISNVTGRVATADGLQPAYWRRHVREGVRFAESIRKRPGHSARASSSKSGRARCCSAWPTAASAARLPGYLPCVAIATGWLSCSIHWLRYIP